MNALDVYGLAAGVLRGVGFGLGAGECAVLTGPSGSGKTTLLRAVSGLVVPERGRVVLDGQDVTGGPPERIAAAGMVRVPERRRIFGRMSAADNLALGGWTRPRSVRSADLDRILELFSRLRPWLNRPGAALLAARPGGPRVRVRPRSRERARSPVRSGEREAHGSAAPRRIR